MRRFFMLILFVLTSSLFCYSNDSGKFLELANKFKSESQYAKAIRYYSKAIRSDDEKVLDVKNIYFQIADCFQKQNKHNLAVRVIKSSIYNYGATKEDIANSNVLDEDFKKKALLEIDHNYNSYRQKYIANLENVDEYLENEEIVLN